jgi:hypothetical protein
MSPIEQAAFISAYCQNGDAPETHVRHVLALIEDGKDVPYDEYYTDIFDALSIWHEALRWQLEFMKSAYATT